MIGIRIDMETLELEISGHANSAEKGKDLVCCAVSTLAQTLAAYMEKQMGDGNLSNLSAEVQDGYVYLNPTPYGWSMQDTVTAFKTIREGFRTLARDYGEYIRLEEE